MCIRRSAGTCPNDEDTRGIGGSWRLCYGSGFSRGGSRFEIVIGGLACSLLEGLGEKGFEATGDDVGGHGGL